MSRFEPWPLVQIDGEWSIPDEILRLVWYKMQKEDKVKAVWYDGGVTSEEEWFEFIKSPVNYPVLIIDKERQEVVMLAWLNGLRDGTAQCHFCILGPYRRGVEKVVMEYWSGWPDGNGGRLLKVLIGITPESYDTTLKLVRMAGFTTLETRIPNMCNLIYEGRRVSAVISYYTPGGA